MAKTFYKFLQSRYIVKKIGLKNVKDLFYFFTLEVNLESENR